jgi:hypothetical protein
LALEVYDDVDVPAALRAVRCDLVYRGEGRILASYWQQALLVFSQERMSAVSTRNGRNAVSACVVLGRGANQEVAAGALFAARIVCKEIL